MGYSSTFAKFAVSTALIGISTFAIAANKPVIWRASFHDVMPNRTDVTKTYCRSHSPDVFQTTIKQITTTGVKSHNGVMVKYKDYNVDKEHGLYFIQVDAIMWGKSHGKPWSEDMYLHEQKLTPNGLTDVVWSTRNCKGKFTGKAINVKSR